MGGVNKVEVINSKGCSKLFVGFSSSVPSFRSFQSFEPMSPASTSLGSEPVRSTGPFSGLVICVTGLSKEARKQVMEATERLGGQYSTSLHPQCTHLVVQSVTGRKFDHAVKHGSRNGLFLVKLGWFVDSVKRNVRLSESLYTVKGAEEHAACVDELNRLAGSTASESSCLPSGFHEAKKLDMIGKANVRYSGRVLNRSMDSVLSGHTIYIDSDISVELRNKILEAASEEGAMAVDGWFVGCSASHVVCEGNSVHRYIGNSNNIVTPLWVLKTAEDRNLQRLVHMSADLARQIGILLEKSQKGIVGEVLLNIFLSELQMENNVASSTISTRSVRGNASHEERQQIVHLAKTGVRNHRSLRMQTCQNPFRPISPTILLETVCWSISEPTSTASIFTDTVSGEDASEHQSVFFDANGDGKDSETSFTNITRSLTESEKNELIFKNHFLTILFPVDRFSEMGPSSRTYFSNNGFTCLQILDYIYAFYQENMSVHEIEAAIHTDSRHADRLRSAYCSKETIEHGYTVFKRIDFLGSRKSFEMLKRVSGDNNSNVYELLIRA
ncbi:hypothetical protein ERO13_A05G037800v2 [Gossypium hirsutum]|uniref:Uncharacterized protein isoform X1 n=1 Tax=Gossypium hirsutum TaxID=3635 RepID=A0A1U8PG26_GOSHI|nr:uncharacterized protein LOC107958806 isoform X1 [Gossypium hirsutum]KAG4197662.1 hypothetical protein ERO13_A05G037800v2 [Gossypium hirsutum]